MIVSWLLAAGLYVLLLFLLSRKGKKPLSRQTTPPRPISVVVALHNEAHNLPRLLNSLAGQSHDPAEYILVLDRCTDDSLAIIQQWQNRIPGLMYLEIEKTPENWSPKKWALQQGIEATSFELLAFTDADCWMGPDWLSHIHQQFDDSTELVLGISPYDSQVSWLNRFIQFETWYTALQYTGLASMGFPYMGVGRNLAYRKSWFQKNGGLHRFAHYLSGDDDLLVNAYGKGSRTTVMFPEASWTYSEPETTWKDWFRQKTRHLSGSVGYSWQSKAVLSLIHLTHFWFYLGIFLILSIGFQPSLIFCVYSIRVILGGLIFYNWLPKHIFPGVMRWYPILDFLFFLYNLIVVPIGLIKPPSWQKQNPKVPKTLKKTEPW